MKKLVFSAACLLCCTAFSAPLQCRTDKTNAKECAQFRERVKQEDARRMATFNAVNEAHVTSSSSSIAVSVPGNVRIGMTSYEALSSTWGRPSDVNRTTTANSVREQWIYPGHKYLYFRNGVLESIQD